MKIGSIDINQPLMLAPMEDVTNLPFRGIAKRLGADIVFTEFTSCEAIIRDIPKSLKKLQLDAAERPAAIQLFGSVPASMALATQIAEKFQPDFIDINAGCSAKKHAARGEGSGLLRDLDNFEAIVRAVVGATKLPVTVKTRLGWNQDSICILDVARMVEDCGAQMLSVHCRTKMQAYKGKADWRWLEKIRKVISIPLIGNGDVNCGADAKQLFECGCDGVMIGRGALSNPWIFEQIKHYLKTGLESPLPSVAQRVALCIDHLNQFVQFYGDERALFSFRKYFSGYFKGVAHISKLRSDLMQLQDQASLVQRLNLFIEQSQNYSSE